MKAKHIYWFAPYQMVCPSTRYRGKYPLDYLEAYNGISNHFIMPEWSLKSIIKFIKIYCHVLFFRKEDSVIVIQKIVSNRFYANALKILVLFRKEATLYDLDDAEYLRNKTDTLHFFLSHCSAISVGSQELQRYALQFNENVFIQTSPTRIHHFQKLTKNTKFTIGWVGDFGNGNELSKSFSHKTSLYNLLFPQIRNLDFELKLCLIGIKTPSDIPEIHQYFSECPNVELDILENLDWTEDSWLYQHIATWDIGVSPIIMHPFNNAKSAFKAKQCLSCGIPVLASPVGENDHFVKHGKNGFICENAEDFYSYILRFKTMNSDEYDSFSQNALQSQNMFSISKYADGLLKYFQKIA